MAAYKGPGAITASTGHNYKDAAAYKYKNLQHQMVAALTTLDGCKQKARSRLASTGQELSWLLLHTSERSPFVASSPAPQITTLTEPDSATGLSQTNYN